MGYVRVKIGLTGQFDRRHPGNYLKPCTEEVNGKSTQVHLPLKLTGLASDLRNNEFQHLALEIVMTSHLINKNED